MECKDCKYYEAYHKRGNSTYTHWCTRCHQEIRYVRESPFRDSFVVRIPGRCYYNNYFERSQEAIKKWESLYVDYGYGLANQVED